MFSLVYSKLTFANEICGFDNVGVYNDILNAFVTTANTWQAKLLPLVTRIFWGVFAAEFLYQLTFKKILSNDLSKLYVFFVIRIFTAYIFAFIFLNLQTYMGIIGFFTRIGAELGGYQLDFGGTTGGMGITPSGLISYLTCKFSVIMAILAAASAIPMIGGMQDYFGISLLVIGLLIHLIAVMFLVTMLDIYVVLFGGFILVGFSGSSWTQSYWQKYLSYAVGSGIRLFITCLILGLVVTSFSNVTLDVNVLNILIPISLLPKLLGYAFAMLGVGILSVYLLMTVPSKAASMLTGSMGGGMGELVGAASMLMAGGSMAKLAGGGAKSQASALMEKLNGPGKNPSPSTLKPNTTTATQSAKNQTAQAGKVDAMSKSMGQGEQPTPKPKFNDSLPDSGSNSPSSSSSRSTPTPSSSTGSPSSSSSGSTPTPSSSTDSPSSSSSGSAPAPSSSAGSPSSSSSGPTPTPSSSTGSPSSSSSGSAPAPSSSTGSPSSSSSGSTPAPSSSAGSPSSSSSGSAPAPSSSAGSPSSSSSGSNPAPSSSGGNSGSIGGGKGSTTPQPSTKATLAKHGKSFADSVNKVSSGHAGAADININPHKE